MPRLAILLLLTLMTTRSAHAEPAAFGIEPFKAGIVPDGLRKGQIYQLRNPADTPQAIQIHVETWDIDENGNEINHPDNGSFNIYPDQFVLQPSSTIAVRVGWTKGGPVETEQAYRLVAEQLPVTFGKGKAKPGAVRFLLTYRAALYVSPPGANADVGVSSFRHVGEGEGRNDKKEWLEFILVNKGNGHTLLKSPVITLTGASGKTVTIRDKARLAGFSGENLMAGHARRFRIPWPEGVDKQPKALKLDFSPDF